MKQAFTHYATSQKSLRKGFRIHLLAFVLGVPAIWILWLLTSTIYPWPIWPTISWTLGLAFHYLPVYVFKNKNAIN